MYFFHFSFAGSGRVRARISLFRAGKKMKPTVTTYQKRIVFPKKFPL